MPNETTEARFPINFEGNASEFADEGTASLEDLKEAIRGTTESFRENNATLRALRGTSEEVKVAREQLKAKIDAERTAISAHNLALLKQGTSYERLLSLQKKEQKALEEQRKALAAKQLEELKAKQDAMREALSASGGPLGGWIDKLKSAQTILGGGGGFVLLAGLSAAAVVALSAAAVAGVASLARWAIAAANASRAMGIMREAASGSAENAHNLGTQVDALWRSIPTGRTALNELATDLTRTLSGSRVSGQGIVDTFNAVASASSAMGDEVGSQLRGIIDRGKQFGRIGIGLNELQGTGLNLEDVAAPLAKGMKTSVEEARRALVYGMVPIDAGAKALRDAVDKRFGQINAKKLLDLNVIAEKFSDRLQGLARGFNVEPILRALDELSSMFDESTVTGDALKQLVTVFGQAIGATFTDGTPKVKLFFQELVIWTQRGILWLLRTGNTLKGVFKSPAALGTLKATLLGIVAVLAVLGGTLAVIGAAFVAAAAFVGLFVQGVAQIGEALGDATFAIVSLAQKWWQAGRDLVIGFANGIKDAANYAVDAVKNLGKRAWGALRSFWQARSPSRKAFGLGEDIGEGNALGIESKGDRIAAAATGTGKAAAGGMAGAGGGGRSVTIGSVTVIVQGGGAGGAEQGRQAAEAFYAKALALFEGLAAQDGIPTQAEPA